MVKEDEMRQEQRQEKKKKRDHSVINSLWFMEQLRKKDKEKGGVKTPPQ